VNPFVEHHRQSIRLQYSCFDRMLLNAVVQPMRRPALIVGFLDKCKQVPSITRTYFRQRWFCRESGGAFTAPGTVTEPIYPAVHVDSIAGDGLAHVPGALAPALAPAVVDIRAELLS
jgi:hypothetical protein